MKLMPNLLARRDVRRFFSFFQEKRIVFRFFIFTEKKRKFQKLKRVIFREQRTSLSMRETQYRAWQESEGESLGRMSWTCHNYHPATKNPPREGGRKLSWKDSVLWRKRFKLLSLVSFKNRVKNRPKNAVKIAGSTQTREAKFSDKEAISASAFCRCFCHSRHRFGVAGW